MSRGIGAYYSPSKFRPVPRGGQGIGAYYSPSPLRPVPPAPQGMQPASPVEGWESLDPGTKSFLAILGLVALGYFFLKGQR